MAIIKTENLTYTYSIGTPFEKTAVDNVNLEIEEGELVGIIGQEDLVVELLLDGFDDSGVLVDDLQGSGDGDGSCRSVQLGTVVDDDVRGSLDGD